MKPLREGWWGRAPKIEVLLPLAFGLTVACFLTSTGIAEFRARGIEAAATSIAINASPTIYYLSLGRTELRRMELVLDDYARRSAAGEPTEDLAERLRVSRQDFGRQWGADKSVPYYPGERELAAEIDAAIAAMDAAIDRMRQKAVTDPKSVDDELDRVVRPAIERLDADLLGDIDFNARHVAELGASISTMRTQQRALSAALDALSVCLAALAAWGLARVLSHYQELAQKRMSELEMFAGRVAHDIRGPLTAVGLAIESTRRLQPAAGSPSAMLDRATRSLQRVVQVVDGLLVFARAGVRPEEGVGADADAVVRGVFEELFPVARDKEIELRLERVDPGIVACSPGVLTSVLSNLVGNAIKYMGEGPLKQVRVRALDKGTKLRFEVEDSGPGVPRELGDRIFDPYVRAASSSIPGLGLGLATVRRLAEAHGGRVGYAPGAAGGSCFWVELPRTTTEASAG